MADTEFDSFVIFDLIYHSRPKRALPEKPDSSQASGEPSLARNRAEPYSPSRFARTLEEPIGTTTAPGTSTTALTATSEAIQSDGKIVVAGAASVSGPGNSQISEIVLTRFNKVGSLDKTFGTNGSVTTDFGSGGNAAIALTVEHDGKILVAADVLNTGLCHRGLSGRPNGQRWRPIEVRDPSLNADRCRCN